jgi:hypothetical protein
VRAIELLGENEFRIYDPRFERIYMPAASQYYTFKGSEHWYDLRKGPEKDVYLVAHEHATRTYFVRGNLKSPNINRIVKEDGLVGHFRRVNPPPPEHEIE